MSTQNPLSKSVFTRAQIVEIRPERKVRLLHLPHPASDVTIFFVHGGCAKMEQFEMIIEQLAPQYSIVAYDAFGCGGSPKQFVFPNIDIKAYSSNAHSSDLLAIFNRYAGDINIGVGHSFGSSLIMRLASQFTSKNLEGLVLLGSALTMKEGGHPVFRLPLYVLECLQPVLEWRFKRIAFHPSTPESIKKRSKCDNPMVVVKYFYSQFSWVRKDVIPNLILPVLLIHGESDWVAPLKGAEALSRALPNAVLKVVQRCGHQVMEENPDEVRKSIEEFVQHTVIRELSKHGILNVLYEKRTKNI